MAFDDPDHLHDLFSRFGKISVRRMFGGLGIFAEGLMIALVADGELYFKADDKTIPGFKAEGAGPFVYGARGRSIVMSYWRVPERLIEDTDEFAEWARAAQGCARRAAASRPALASKRKAAAGKRNRRRSR